MKINLKKKENIIGLSLVLFTIAVISVMPFDMRAASKGKYYKAYLGDVNLDGKVSSKDVTLILKKCAGYEKNKALADVNQDGKINTKDSTLATKMTINKKKRVQVDTFIDRFGNVAILYKQNDSTNKDQAYLGRYKHDTYITTWNGRKINGSDKSSDPKLGPNGCGPTSCAIVATSFGKNVTPKTLVNGNKKCYSTTEEIEAYFKSIGLKTERINRDLKTYQKSIEKGKKLILLVGTSDYSSAVGKVGTHRMGNGTFHWFTILDADDNGNFYVADPYLYSGKSNCQWINFNNITGIYTTIAVGK